MCRRLTPQKAQQRMALLAQSSQPLSPSAGVFPRNDPDVTGQSLAVAKPFRIAQETSVARAVIGPTPGCVISSPAVVRSPARSSTRSVVRSLLRTWRTSPATHCADERCAWSEATRRWLLARFHSKANFLAVNHSPGQSPAAHSVSGFAVVPTDDGARATLGDPAVPSKVAKSKENGFRPATLKAARHLADHASVCGVRPSNRRRMTNLAVDPYTHRTWKRGIKLPRAVAFVRQSLVHNFSRRGVEHRQRLLASVQITSYNPHLGLLRSEHCWGEHRTVYSGRREADVVMTSIRT